MAQNNINFLNNIWPKLKGKLDILGSVCNPSADLIRPSFRFKFSSDFRKNPVKITFSNNPDEPRIDLEESDVLKCRYLNCLEPCELKDISSRKRLMKDMDIDYIDVNGKKWLFYKYDKVGKFFLQDGSREVVMEFAPWLDTSEILKIPEARAATTKVLKQCMGETFPTEKQARECFTDKVCQKISGQNSAQEAVKMATLSCLEVLQDEIVPYLNATCYLEIIHSSHFKQFVEDCKKDKEKGAKFSKDPTKEHFRKYLENRENKKNMYFWAERKGLIPSAQRMIQYEQARNHIRHPNEVPDTFIDANQVYKDFCAILNTGPSTFPSKVSEENIIDCTCLYFHLDSLGAIKSIMDEHANPEYVDKKKKRDKYYKDLLQKKIITKGEQARIKKMRKPYNALAHGSSTKQTEEEIMENENRVFDLEYALYKRHCERTRS